MGEYDKMKIFLCSVLVGAGVTFGVALVMPLVWAGKYVMGWLADDVIAAMYAGIIVGMALILFVNFVSRGLYHD